MLEIRSLINKSIWRFLTRFKKKNIGKPVYAVGIDSCEDRNAYGNNYQWCVASGPNQITPYNTNGWTGNWPQGAPSDMKIIQGTFDINEDNNYAQWKADCQKDNSCKNLAGYKGHFDIGIQHLPPEFQELAIPWLQDNQDKSGFNYNWNNLIVKATPIECPDAIKDAFKTSCGGNSTLDQNKCFYCLNKTVNNGQPGSLPYSDGRIPEWWGACTHNQKIPLNNTSGSCTQNADCQFSSETNEMGFNVSGSICKKGTDGIGRCELPTTSQKPWIPPEMYNCPRGSVVEPNGQCGGLGWKEIGCSTTCQGKQKCVYHDEYYSGCVGSLPKKCARQYKQCGGINWIGPTYCGSSQEDKTNCKCIYQNDNYSQCQ